MKTDWKRIILVIGIIVFVIILDFTSKDWATNTLMGRPVQSYLGDFFRLLYVRNEGAFLSLGSDLPPFFQFIVPSFLAYGKEGLQNKKGHFLIPPDETLVFEIEVL